MKTRLAKVLSNSLRFSLYKAFLRDTINLASAVTCEMRILAYSCPVNQKPLFLSQIAPAFRFHRQKPFDFGERLSETISYAQQLGNEQVVVIGTDSPDLPAPYIQMAFDKLKQSDMVVGPCEDGGFYLLGLRTLNPLTKFANASNKTFSFNKEYLPSSLFHEIRWSTSDTLAQLMANARHLKKTIYLLPQWSDVDNSQGLEKLIQRLNKNNWSAPWTRRILVSANILANEDLK